ncbi:hypothetical protein KW792_02390 [Candidatus Saccharibacteria bacterium]|nr:hypothetical protein [Candidatus Saccharibacteria bacterium]
MNPTVAQPTIPRPAMDIARPMVRPQPRPAPRQQPVAVAPAAPVPVSAPTAAPPANPAASTTLTTSIVSNIPIHAPTAPAPAANEDAELEKIMLDVGHELKQADRKHTKKHFSLLGHKKHPSAPAVPKAAHVIDIKPAAKAAPTPQPAAPAATHSPAKAPATVQKKSSTPVGVIFVTILITGALIAAAVFSYK